MAIVTQPQDIAALTTSGRILAGALRAVAAVVAAGKTTRELDVVAEDHIRSAGAAPSFLGYQGYPASLCVSINDEVVHGIPSERQLAAGDVIGLDLGVNYQGWFTDAAITVVVEPAPKEIQKFLADTAESLRAGIAAAKVGGRIGDIGAAVSGAVRPHGYGIIVELCGHGVGRAVHEPPQILNVGRSGTGPKIVAGAVLAIEPMLTLGSPGVHTRPDGWTVATNDGSIAAHFEHTVLVTATGPIILTA